MALHSRNRQSLLTVKEVTAAETNATKLAVFYKVQHQQYRGVDSPQWGSSDDQKVLSNGTRELPVDIIGEAFELLTSPVSGQHLALGGEGTIWHGVDTLISPPDAAAYSTLMWQHKPSLIIEIGTECGGSAVFFAMIMRQYAPGRARVLTYDVMPTYWRCGPIRPDGRRTEKAYKSRLWKNLTAEGTIVARFADISTPEEQATVRRFVTEAAGGGVWVIDDGDHFSTPLLVHFHLFARYVTPNGYYVVADTRLERTCRLAFKNHIRTRYCSMILHGEGGPGRAVHYLRRHNPLLLSGRLFVDRHAERWILTQHPGGWLRCNGSVPLPQEIIAHPTGG